MTTIEPIQYIIQTLGGTNIFGQGLAIPTIFLSIAIARGLTWESRKQEVFLIITSALLTISTIFCLATTGIGGGLLTITTLAFTFYAYQSMVNSEKESGKV